MSVILAYLIYLVTSVGFTVVVGRALLRNGRAFLLEAFSSDEAAAGAVTRLLVVGFYLLSLGFVALIMRMPSNIGNFSRAVQLLSVKIGEVLMALGALHLASLFLFARLRRPRGRASTPAGRAQPSLPPPRQEAVAAAPWRAGSPRAAP